MLKFIKYTFLALITIVVGYVAIGLVFGIVLFWNAPDCSGNSDAANYIRSLSDKRLERLHQDMEMFYKAESDHYKEYFSASEEGLPAEFKDLKVVRVSPKSLHIMVVGCFDNYMYLHFEGIKDSGERAVLLQYGEHEITTEKVWPK